MNKWRVDTGHLLEIIAANMYSNPLEAGIRELITNSLDAKSNGKVNINLDIWTNGMSYSDDGIGINPEDFHEIYGKIASGHERTALARGFFGIGRMALIVQAGEGLVSTVKEGKKYSWRFNIDGWEERLPEDTAERYGVYLWFNNLPIQEDLETLKNFIRETFAIPMHQKECEITFNGEILSNLIPEDALINSTISKYGPLMVFHHPKTDGRMYLCQKGILVRKEDYVGLEAWIDQSFLTIKTDREGFVNDVKYRFFMKEVKKELALFRPAQTFKKMEVDFIKSLMKGFKRYWIKKIEKEGLETIPLKLEFPEAGKEVMEEKEGVLPEETGTIQKEGSQPMEPKQEQQPFIHVENDWSKVPTLEELDKNIEEIEKPMEVSNQVESPLPNAEVKQEDVSTIDEGQVGLSTPEKVEPTRETPIQPEEQVVTIKGAKPVEMGEDYPVVFMEKEPFTLLFNTNHPIMKKLIEKGKVSSEEMAVIYERMMECAYESKFTTENLEILKTRWTEVDKRLKELFK